MKEITSPSLSIVNSSGSIFLLEKQTSSSQAKPTIKMFLNDLAIINSQLKK